MYQTLVKSAGLVRVLWSVIPMGNVDRRECVAPRICMLLAKLTNCSVSVWQEFSKTTYHVVAVLKITIKKLCTTVSSLWLPFECGGFALLTVSSKDETAVPFFSGKLGIGDARWIMSRKSYAEMHRVVFIPTTHPHPTRAPHHSRDDFVFNGITDSPGSRRWHTWEPESRWKW